MNTRGRRYLVTKNVGPNLMPFETAHLTLLKVSDFGTSGNPCSIWKLTYQKELLYKVCIMVEIVL